MADLRIVDAPVLLQESITDDVKMPTGGLGNFSVRLGDILWYVITKEQLANKNYVDLSSKGVKDSLDEHIADKNNPHQVTKAQVGLGNVDNTSDIDKPISSAVGEALSLKADKAYTLAGYGIVDAYTQTQLTNLIDTVANTTYAGHKGYATLAAAQAAQASLPANTLVEVTSDTTTANNGVYLWNGTTLVKSSNDVLGQAKKYIDSAIVENNENTDGYYKTTNLVKPNQQTQQGYFGGDDASGIIYNSDYPDYYVGLDFYPVSANQKLWMMGIGTGQVIGLYDSNKNSIMPVHSNAVINNIYTVPNNPEIAYIRIGTSLGADAFTSGKVAMGYGDKLPPKILAYNETYSDILNADYLSVLNKIAINNAIDYTNDFVAKFINLVKPNQQTQQGYFNGSTIVSNPTFPNYYVGLDYYPVKPNQKLWILGVGTGQIIQLYKADKTAITYGTHTGIVNNIYTVPNNPEIAYIRIGTSLGADAFSTGKVAMGYGDVAPIVVPTYNTAYFEPKNAFIQGIQNTQPTKTSLTGKKWIAMGDSITAAANSYCNVIATRYNANLDKTYAVSGAKIHKKSADETAYILSEAYLNIPLDSDPDLITVAAGTNDYTPAYSTYQQSIGTMSDRTNTTFYGALHVLLSGLRARFPDARIGFISQIPRGDVRYTRYDDYVTNKQRAVSEVCDYYSIPLWEGYKEFGANPTDSQVWQDKYMPDGLHPSVDGNIWYANRVEQFVLNLAK